MRSFSYRDDFFVFVEDVCNFASMKGTVKHIILFIALIAAFAAVEVLGPIFRNETFKGILRSHSACFVQLLLCRYQSLFPYPYRKWVNSRPFPSWR